MEAAGILAYHVGQCARECHGQGEHQAGIAGRQTAHGIAPFLGSARHRVGGFDGVGILEHHDFPILPDGFVWGHEHPAVPSQAIHAPRPIFHRPDLQEGRQQVAGFLAGRDCQAQPRQFAPYVRAVALQEFQRHRPLMGHAVVVLPFQQAPPLARLGVAGLGTNGEAGANPQGGQAFAILAGADEGNPCRGDFKLAATVGAAFAAGRALDIAPGALGDGADFIRRQGRGALRLVLDLQRRLDGIHRQALRPQRSRQAEQAVVAPAFREALAIGCHDLRLAVGGGFGLQRIQQPGRHIGPHVRVFHVATVGRPPDDVTTIPPRIQPVAQLARGVLQQLAVGIAEQVMRPATPLRPVGAGCRQGPVFCPQRGETVLAVLHIHIEHEQTGSLAGRHTYQGIRPLRGPGGNLPGIRGRILEAVRCAGVLAVGVLRLAVGLNLPVRLLPAGKHGDALGQQGGGTISKGRHAAPPLF